MREFERIRRLPPYVFNITNELKMAARRRGEDVIDLSMGNPDGPTPKHIVDKLVEATQRQDTHGYSVSKGIRGCARRSATGTGAATRRAGSMRKRSSPSARRKASRT
jgi:aspartate/methionine/tyrosine aminotransferase